MKLGLPYTPSILLFLLTLFSSLRVLASPLIIPQRLSRRQGTPPLNFTQYRIFNNCPAPINLYIAGGLDSVLPTGGNTTKFLNVNAGYFYTDANGGSGSGIGTLRAGFFGEQYYYYMVRDMNGPLNTGMSVAPQDRPSNMGFCQEISCEDNNCAQAFPTPPRRFPPPGPTAPDPPLYQCPFTNTTYIITFCPSGSWPDPPVWRIHPTLNHPEKCLDVRAGVVANGTAVQIYDCNGSPAQDWVLNRGSTKVRLAGTGFCLDAGGTPANGVGMKIWQCYDNLPAQQWYFTDDNRIALEGKGQCLDLPNGDLTNSNQVQTWQCTDNNQNQVWVL